MTCTVLMCAQVESAVTLVLESLNPTATPIIEYCRVARDVAIAAAGHGGHSAVDAILKAVDKAAALHSKAQWGLPPLLSTATATAAAAAAIGGLVDYTPVVTEAMQGDGHSKKSMVVIKTSPRRHSKFDAGSISDLTPITADAALVDATVLAVSVRFS